MSVLAFFTWIEGMNCFRECYSILKNIFVGRINSETQEVCKFEEKRCFQIRNRNRSFHVMPNWSEVSVFCNAKPFIWWRMFALQFKIRNKPEHTLAIAGWRLQWKKCFPLTLRSFFFSTSSWGHTQMSILYSMARQLPYLTEKSTFAIKRIYDN